MKHASPTSWFALMLALIFLVACGAPPTHQTTPTSMPPTPPPTPVRPTATAVGLPPSEADVYAFEQNARLGHGVNLGNALEAPNEGEWGVTLQEEYFKWIKEAGFSHVRLPVRFSEHAAQETPYTIDPVFFERVDWAVDNALKNDLVIIIDMHHYLEIMETPDIHEERFLALWEQIANRYKDYPDSVFFEPLNEPNGMLGTTQAWNRILNETIQTIRKTNPKRIIVTGPGNWYAVGMLFDLQLPENDRNIIVSFHYYSPFHFTHQGAEWADGSDAWLGTTWSGTEDEKKAVRWDFDQVLKWTKYSKRPIYMGEFGAYSKADMDSRAIWTDYVARQAEARGWSWAYWEFCSGFGVFNADEMAWREPLLQALNP